MDYVYITGTVDADGRFTSGWWSTPPAEAVRAAQAEPSSEQDWIAVALSDGDDILARAPAPLLAVPICPGGSSLNLSALLALPDATSSVAIMEGTREVFRRVVPDPAAVRLDKHLGPRLLREQIELPVHIDGPEPRSGAYIVAAWEAPGHPPLSLGLIGIGAGEPAVVRLDLTELPGGEGCRLSVTYFDAIRSVTTSSAPLSLEARPAVPVIVAPTPGMKMFDDSWLSLAGRLDGDGDPEALEWLVDEEVVGTGVRAGVARPAAGARTVTLRYGTTRASVEIMVLPVPTQEIVPPLWEPPWRSTLFRSLSTLYLGPKESETTE
jgi:hypothetical protein